MSLTLPDSIAKTSAPRPHTHVCPIHGCAHRVSDTKLLCFHHWRMVPPHVRHIVYEAWNGGDPDAFHPIAMQHAITIVNTRLGVQRGL